MREKATPRDVMNASEQLVLMAGDLIRQNPRELQEIQAFVIDRLADREIPRSSGELDTFAADLVHEMFPQILNDSTLREPVRKLLARTERVIQGRKPESPAPSLTREATAGSVLFGGAVIVAGSIIVSLAIYGAIRHYQCVKYKDC